MAGTSERKRKRKESERNKKNKKKRKGKGREVKGARNQNSGCRGALLLFVCVSIME